MGYANHDRHVLTVQEKTADDLTGALDDNLVLDIVEACTLVRVGAVITTAVSSATDTVVKCDRRILTGSDVGRIVGGNAAHDAILTIPTGTGVGKVVYDDVRIDLNPGDQLVFNLTTAATVTGGARYYAVVTPRDEDAANLTDMVST